LILTSSPRDWGIEIVPTVAVQGRGLDNLLKAIARARPPAIESCYAPSMETAIQRVSTLLPHSSKNRRSTALRLLSGDPQLAERLRLNGSLTQIRDELAACCACGKDGHVGAANAGRAGIAGRYCFYPR
jgi:Fe2+ transport system protein B